MSVQRGSVFSEVLSLDIRVDQAQLVMQGFGQSREQLGLSRVALVSGHSDLIEDRMQLADDGRHLRGQVAGVHGWRHAGRGRMNGWVDDLEVSLRLSPRTTRPWSSSSGAAHVNCLAMQSEQQREMEEGERGSMLSEKQRWSR